MKMSDDKKKYLTAHQIDGHKGIKSPHARELENIGNEKASLFSKDNFEILKGIVENRLRGKIENIDFDEDYTITLEFFPECKVHFLYFNYEEDEDEPFGSDELRILFSGDRIAWIPTEDSIGFIEAVFNLIENLLNHTKQTYELPERKRSWF